MEGTLQPDPPPLTGADLAAALHWWRDAGVDMDFSDTPVSWLDAETGTPAPATERPPSSSAMPEPRPAPAIAPIAADLPGDLSGFVQWWLSEPSLDGAQVRGRVAPRGPVGAPVMILVAQPEAADSERLLSGPEGSLLDAMLNAMGIAPDAAYVASALPRHTPMADFNAAAAAGLGRVIARHITLAAPQRLIVLGRNILPLVDNNLPHTAKDIRVFNQEGFSVPLLGGMELGALLAQPRRKAAFWKLWLEWAQLDGKITA